MPFAPRLGPLTSRPDAPTRPPPVAVIACKVGILAGRSRVDVACMRDRLDGFKIHLSADTIDRRLDRQVAAYNRVLDRAALWSPRRN